MNAICTSLQEVLLESKMLFMHNRKKQVLVEFQVDNLQVCNARFASLVELLVGISAGI